MKFLGSSHKERRTQTFRAANEKDGRVNAVKSDDADWRARREEKPNKPNRQASIPKSKNLFPGKKCLTVDEKSQQEISDLKHQLNIARRSKQAADDSNRQLKKEVQERKKHQAGAERSKALVIQSVKREVVTTETQALSVPAKIVENVEQNEPLPAPIQEEEVPESLAIENFLLESPDDVETYKYGDPRQFYPGRNPRMLARRKAEAEAVRSAIRKHGSKKVLTRSYLGKLLPSLHEVAQVGSHIDFFGATHDISNLFDRWVEVLTTSHDRRRCLTLPDVKPTYNWLNLNKILESYIECPLSTENAHAEFLYGKELPK